MTSRARLPDFTPKEHLGFFIGYIPLLVAQVIFGEECLSDFMPKERLSFFAGCIPLLTTSVISIKGLLAHVRTVSEY